MALTWEYYPSNLMTDVEDKVLPAPPLAQAAVALKEESAEQRSGGEWPLQSASGTDKRLHRRHFTLKNSSAGHFRGAAF